MIYDQNAIKHEIPLRNCSLWTFWGFCRRGFKVILIIQNLLKWFEKPKVVYSLILSIPNKNIFLYKRKVADRALITQHLVPRSMHLPREHLPSTTWFPSLTGPNVSASRLDDESTLFYFCYGHFFFCFYFSYFARDINYKPSFLA